MPEVENSPTEDPASFLAETLTKALGLDGDGEDQMIWSATLAILAYLATPIGTVVTAAAGVVFTITFIIGLLRFLVDLAQ